MFARKYAILVLLLAIATLVTNSAAFSVDQGMFRLYVGEDNHFFSLAIKDPLSGTYYRIGTGNDIDVSRLNASLGKTTNSENTASPSLKISHLRVGERTQAGAGAPCVAYYSLKVQVANTYSEKKTVYVQGVQLTIDPNSKATVTIDHYWQCQRENIDGNFNVILSEDADGFTILDQRVLPSNFETGYEQ